MGPGLRDYPRSRISFLFKIHALWKRIVPGHPFDVC